MGDSAHGDGSDNPKSNDGDSDSQKYMTPEQFNRAFSAREKAFEKKLASMLDDKFSKFAPAAPAKKPDEGGDGDGEPGDNGMTPAMANMMKSFKSRMTKLENDNKGLRSELSEERNQANKEKMRREVLENLGKHGIEGIHGTHAMGHLVDAAGKVRLSDDGTPVFHNGDFETSLEEGLEEWAKSEEASLYRPPKPDQGSGERGGGSSSLPTQGGDLRSAARDALANIA